jgi:ElaB/YqjD/DUF883 family membrane-anchored ribosome-binding protein
MASQANADIAALQTAIDQLRNDMAEIAATLREMASKDVAKEGLELHVSAEKVWTEVKRQAGNMGREIEDKPVASALAAFGVGILAGLFLNRHCG